MEILEFLKQRCPEDQIAVNKQGYLHIPIDTMERKLDALSEFNTYWGTKKYQSRLYEFGGSVYISASIELCTDGDYKINLVGAATFNTADYGGITHADPIAKSLCVVNAAYDLGDQFGRFISRDSELLRQENNTKSNGKQPIEIVPDKGIIEQYKKAILHSDLKKTDALKAAYPSIEQYI